MSFNQYQNGFISGHQFINLLNGVYMPVQCIDTYASTGPQQQQQQQQQQYRPHPKSSSHHQIQQQPPQRQQQQQQQQQQQHEQQYQIVYRIVDQPMENVPVSTKNQSEPAKRTRVKFAPHQLETLEKFFVKNPYPSSNQLDTLAYELDLTKNNVKFWFQNYRQYAINNGIVTAVRIRQLKNCTRRRKPKPNEDNNKSPSSEQHLDAVIEGVPISAEKHQVQAMPIIVNKCPNKITENRPVAVESVPLSIEKRQVIDDDDKTSGLPLCIIYDPETIDSEAEQEFAAKRIQPDTQNAIGQLMNDTLRDEPGYIKYEQPNESDADLISPNAIKCEASPSCTPKSHSSPLTELNCTAPILNNCMLTSSTTHFNASTSNSIRYAELLQNTQSYDDLSPYTPENSSSSVQNYMDDYCERIAPHQVAWNDNTFNTGYRTFDPIPNPQNGDQSKDQKQCSVKTEQPILQQQANDNEFDIDTLNISFSFIDDLIPEDPSILSDPLECDADFLNSLGFLDYDLTTGPRAH